MWALTNTITIGSEQTQRDAFLATSTNHDDEDKTNIIYIMLMNLDMKCAKLVANIIEALYKMLKTDEFYHIQGNVSSVYYKMSQLELPQFLEKLTGHAS